MMSSMLTEKQLLSARSTSPLKSEACAAEERATSVKRIERVKSSITVRKEKKAIGKLQGSEKPGRCATVGVEGPRRYRILKRAALQERSTLAHAVMHPNAVDRW